MDTVGLVNVEAMGTCTRRRCALTVELNRPPTLPDILFTADYDLLFSTAHFEPPADRPIIARMNGHPPVAMTVRTTTAAADRALALKLKDCVRKVATPLQSKVTTKLSLASTPAPAALSGQRSQPVSRVLPSLDHAKITVAFPELVAERDYRVSATVTPAQRLYIDDTAAIGDAVDKVRRSALALQHKGGGVLRTSAQELVVVRERKAADWPFTLRLESSSASTIPLTAATQPTRALEAQTWEWEVRPSMASDTVTLRLSVESIREQVTVSEVIPIELTVHRPWHLYVARFIEAYWQWIATSVLVPLASYAAAKRLRKRKVGPHVPFSARVRDRSSGSGRQSGSR